MWERGGHGPQAEGHGPSGGGAAQTHPFTLLSESHALTPIRPAPFIPAHCHAKYYTFLFTVYCYRLFRVANRPRTMRPTARQHGSVNAFKCPKAVICFIRSLLTLKVGLCRHLTELGAFRFERAIRGEWTRFIVSRTSRSLYPLSPQWLPNGSFQLVFEKVFSLLNNVSSHITYNNGWVCFR